jgi:hypothetical protein
MDIKTSAEAIAAAEAYDRAFVRTILRLHGVSGVPTAQQQMRANRTFAHYGLKVRNARRCNLASGAEWPAPRMPVQTAVERAFLFVKFDSVMNMTEVQGIALHDWLNS